MKKRIKKLPDELKVGEIRISETHTVEVQPNLKIYVNGNDHIISASIKNRNHKIAMHQKS